MNKKKAKTLIYGISASLLSISGLLMLWFGISGLIDFGTGTDRLTSLRVWVLLAIFLFSLAQAIIFDSIQKKAFAFIGTFIAILLVAFVLGGVLGIMDASSTGSNFYVGSFWLVFDTSMTAVGDLTVGMNIKLIADSIYYFVPGVAFFIIVFQLLYSGEADEFAKALIEGIAVAIFMIIYSLVSGMPTYI